MKYTMTATELLYKHTRNVHTNSRQVYLRFIAGRFNGGLIVF